MRTDCYYIDTETVGFHGLPVLLQYAYEDGEVALHEPWRVPVRDTLQLIERFCDKTCVFFNASFDWFQLTKLYTTWQLLPADAIPAELPVLRVAEAERDARDGPCVKPRDVLCLMLHSRKGEFQTLMSRHDIRINKVPRPLAQPLCDMLERTIEFDGILFAKRKDPNAPKWKVYDRLLRGKKDEIDTVFQDVVLKFRPARGLKFLAKHCLKLDPEFHSFMDVYPETGKIGELGYVPYALGVSSPKDNWAVRDKKGQVRAHSWPYHVAQHIEHWATNEEARRYGRDDVIYTRMMDEYFGYPEAGDNDSVLACMVASVRWHGYNLDIDKVFELQAEAKRRLSLAPCNLNRPGEVRAFVREVMDESETSLIDKSTKKANLEKIRSTYVVKREELSCDRDVGPCVICEGTGEIITVKPMFVEVSTCQRCLGKGREPGYETCIRCGGDGCPRCESRGYLLLGRTPIAERADFILRCKIAAKEVELYEKLIRAARFHAAFNVIGALSSRMSGAAGLNAQGIKNDKGVRSAFPLKWEGMVLSGGDFDSFEVTLAEAVFQDLNLRSFLQEGKSIHTFMALQMYPGKTEEQILASKGHKDGGDIDMYTRGKQAVFAFLYGGDETTINKKLSIPIATARTAMQALQDKFPGIKESREKVAKALGGLSQPEGIGSKITWSEPDDKVTTFLGFSRYFTLENKIIKALFDLAQNVPREWQCLDMTVVRRDKQQSAAGAVASALYGAAFNIQAANIRAANNHLIQSPGAMITKHLQRRIWDLQPHGVHPFVVAPMNVHDEVLSVNDPSIVDQVAEVVVEVVESYRPQVPLIGMEWARDMDSWGEKGKIDVPIKPPQLDLEDNAYVPPVDLSELAWLEEQDMYYDFDSDHTEWI